MPTAPQQSELTDDEIQQRLSGQSLQTPRFFRGQELAAYTKGARDICLRVILPDDSAAWHDVILVKILTALHAATPQEKLVKRREALVATQDPDTFRARVSIELDDFSDEDLAEARRIVDEILTPVSLAQVTAAPPKAAMRTPKKKAA